MARIAFLLIFIFATSPSMAGPFGFEAGQTLEQVSRTVRLEKVSAFQYKTTKPPNIHAQFDDYRLTITPAHGLCKITAFTPGIESSRYGDEIKSRFDNIFSSLTERYGRSKKFDFLRSGSIWNEPEDWMMGLLKKERSLNAFWDAEEKSNLPADLSSIALQAVGVTSEMGLIALSYDFANARACSDWIKTRQNSAL